MIFMHALLLKNEVLAEAIRGIKRPEFKPNTNKDTIYIECYEDISVYNMIGNMFYNTLIQYYSNMIYNKLRKVEDTFVITHHDRNNMLAELNKKMVTIGLS